MYYIHINKKIYKNFSIKMCFRGFIKVFLKRRKKKMRAASEPESFLFFNVSH